MLAGFPRFLARLQRLRTRPGAAFVLECINIKHIAASFLPLQWDSWESSRHLSVSLSTVVQVKCLFNGPVSFCADLRLCCCCILDGGTQRVAERLRRERALLLSSRSRLCPFRVNQQALWARDALASVRILQLTSESNKTRKHSFEHRHVTSVLDLFENQTGEATQHLGWPTLVEEDTASEHPWTWPNFE